MQSPHCVRIGLSIAVLAGSLIADAAAAPNLFTLEQILAPAFRSELVAAKKANHFAWIAYERGLRNDYTAAGPHFKPVRSTNNREDDGSDLTGLVIERTDQCFIGICGLLECWKDSLGSGNW